MFKLFSILIIGVTICLTGCFSLQIAKEPGIKNHIHVANYEWYLFHTIPLIGGNASPDADIPFAVLRNDVTMDKLQTRLMQEAKRQNREVANLVWNNYDTVLFSFPGTELFIPIPYLITYREMQLSGELK